MIHPWRCSPRFEIMNVQKKNFFKKTHGDFYYTIELWVYDGTARTNNKKEKKKNWKKAKAWQHSRETRPAQPENQLCVHSCMKYVVSCAACRSPRTRSSSLHPTSPKTTQNRYIHCGSSWKKERKTEKKQHVVSVLADVSFFFPYCYMFLILFQSRNKNHPIS